MNARSGLHATRSALVTALVAAALILTSISLAGASSPPPAPDAQAEAQAIVAQTFQRFGQDPHVERVALAYDVLVRRSPEMQAVLNEQTPPAISALKEHIPTTSEIVSQLRAAASANTYATAIFSRLRPSDAASLKAIYESPDFMTTRTLYGALANDEQFVRALQQELRNVPSVQSCGFGCLLSGAAAAVGGLVAGVAVGLACTPEPLAVITCPGAIFIGAGVVGVAATGAAVVATTSGSARGFTFEGASCQSGSDPKVEACAESGRATSDSALISDLGGYISYEDYPAPATKSSECPCSEAFGLTQIQDNPNVWNTSMQDTYFTEGRCYANIDFHNTIFWTDGIITNRDTTTPNPGYNPTICSR